MTAKAHIALLIDADNSPASKIDVILSELAKYGVANIRRAYGNWKSPGLKRWEDVLHEYAIRPMQQFDYTKGKNATDAAMIIDAMDLLYEHELDGFGIVSSDSDFTPLVMRLRTTGAEVYGFGEKKTPMPFVNACSKFLYLENLGQADDTEAIAAAPSPGKPAKPPVAAKPASLGKKGAAALKQDTKLVSLLRNAVEAAASDDGWSNMGAVGTQISNQASFDPRNYGYSRLGDLIKATELFEIRIEGTAKHVRDKRVGKAGRAPTAADAAAPAPQPGPPAAPDAPPTRPR